MTYFCCYCRSALIKTKSSSTSWDPDYYACPNCGAKAMHDNAGEFEHNPSDLEFIKRPNNEKYTIK